MSNNRCIIHVSGDAYAHRIIQEQVDFFVERYGLRGSVRLLQGENAEELVRSAFCAGEQVQVLVISDDTLKQRADGLDLLRSLERDPRIARLALHSNDRTLSELLDESGPIKFIRKPGIRPIQELLVQFLGR